MIDDAAGTAAAALSEAGVALRELHGPDDCRAAMTLLAEIWREEDGPPDIYRALEHAGNYVVGVYPAAEPARMIGASVAFFGPPAARMLHSHITGLLPGTRGRHVGTAVKLHQRAWAMERGVTSIHWTFDPLIRRNAVFNLVRLGATVVGYEQDFYGGLRDGVNQGDETDRLYVSWRIDRPWPPDVSPDVVPGDDHDDVPVVVDVGAEDSPVPADAPAGAGRVRVRVPADIETIRHGDPTLAGRWRRVVRDAIAPRLAAGWSITGVDRDGHYHLHRTSPEE